ncbi:MAG TPA: beta-1-3, beta-1-6-glucan biosynthesis protein, partial [Xanthobacteraceae bacterium]
MVKLVLRAAAVALAVASIAHPVGAPAQTTEQKAADPKDAARSEAMRRRIDEIAEVGRMLTGPAANPECVWLGRRVISLLWRDDLDTA